MIFFVLSMHVYAFIERRAFFPFLAYDVYRKPLDRRTASNDRVPGRFRFVAVRADRSENELGPFDPFFLPFDRFLFSEVLFFDILRVHDTDLEAEIETLQSRLQAQLKKYNTGRKSMRNPIRQIRALNYSGRIVVVAGE